MIQFKRYPNYKDSGVEWLGEIPEEWEVKRLGYLANCFPSNVDKHSKQNEKTVRLCNYTDVYKNDFITDDMDLMIATASDEQIQKFTLKKGDVIITKDSETANDIAVPAYVKEQLTNVVCGYHLAMIQPFKEISSIYLFRALQCKTFNAQFEICSNGITRVGLGANDLKSGLFLVPSLPEQTAIATFLDEKTAKIDKAISQKEQMISLLKERKQILIQNAVTKGIDPNVKMKDSGVEWIGEIPEGWEVMKFKHVYSTTFSGGTPSTDKEFFWNGGIPWISSADVKSTIITNTLRNISAEGLARSSAKMAPSGSIIIVTRSGILQHTLPIAILSMDMAINQDIKCFILKKRIVVEYLMSFIKGKNKEILIETRQQGATVESINLEQFANLQITIPPLTEQTAIVAFIKVQSVKIDTSIALQEKQISKLKEYKTTLIDSAVTGKIKVC